MKKDINKLESNDRIIRIFEKIRNIFFKIHHDDYSYIKEISDEVINDISFDREYIYYDMNKVSIFFKSYDCVAARTKIFNIMAEYENIIKKFIGLFSIGGYDIDNNIKLGIIDNEDIFYESFNGTIKSYDEIYLTKIDFTDIISKAILSFYDSERIISHYLNDKVGCVILSDDPQERKKIRNMIEKAEVIFSSETSIKAQYQDMESKQINYLIIANRHVLENKNIKIKKLHNDQIDCLNSNDIDNYLRNNGNSLIDELYQISLKIYYENIYKNIEKRRYVCSKEDLTQLNKEKYLLIPFNQNVRSKKCFICNENAEKEVLILNKYYE